MREVARPKPLITEVLVRVCAAGTNPVDAFIRGGQFPLLPPGSIPGWDVSGVVEEVVPGVTRFRVGDEVFGMPLFPRPASAYAEYVAAPSRHFALKPKNIDHTQAAALPLAGLTAWQSLVDIAELARGQRVLIHGAGGGVGHLAVQIAKARGAYVLATASAKKLDFVQKLGADEVIPYDRVDFTQVARDVDIVLELVGKDYGARSIGVLRKGGLLITAVERTSAELRARTESAGRRFAGVNVEPDHVGLEGLAGLAEAGKLRAHISHTFSLERAPEAHRLIHAGGLSGKIVLTLPEGRA
jgi:NADPH:quinone reductase-like Zn-dependent oxidoreductase